MKLGIMLFVVCISAYAAEKVDNLGFYASREQQVFNTANKQEFRSGYMKGEDAPYFTWHGPISGKDVYVEVHNERLRVHTGTKWAAFSLRGAHALPSGDKESVTIDDKGADIFVKSAQDQRQSLICIQSLGPDIYMRPRPYWEVYLIKEPLGTPSLYRISGINADCRGIERSPDGGLLVPTWDIQKNRDPGVVIEYYAIEKNGFRKTNVRFTGTIASKFADEYVIDNANK